MDSNHVRTAYEFEGLDQEKERRRYELASTKETMAKNP